MTEPQSSPRPSRLPINLTLGKGIEVSVDPKDDIVWIDMKSTKTTLAFALSSLIDAGFYKGDGTLALALGPGINFIEVPCTETQARALFEATGWELALLSIEPPFSRSTFL